MAKKMRKSYDAAFKARVALEAVKGEKTIAQLSSEYSVHVNQISQWQKRLLQELPDIFSERRKKNEDETEEMKEKLGQMHVNLYVSLYECAPMLPLESLSIGAPCLLGPHSHYFEDHQYLYSRLVVSAPDRAEIIAASAERAIHERDEIIHNYRLYAQDYNHRAKSALQQFLEI